MPNHQPLHLPDLVIHEFRAITTVRISHLQRVTLLVGKNGTGKSTVLDAVRSYAARGDLRVLREILDARDELAMASRADDAEAPVPDWAGLFHDHDPTRSVMIASGGDQLDIAALNGAAGNGGAPRVAFHGRDPMVCPSSDSEGGSDAYMNEPHAPHGADARPIRCELIAPESMTSTTIARLWDGVALTDAEDGLVAALRTATGRDVRRIALVGESNSLRVLVRMHGDGPAIPLRSLGSGAVQFLAVGLALAHCRDGILLMEHVGDGLHRTLQRDLWNMVFETARALNVQVFATTHSWDCISGFAGLARNQGDGLLIRLERGASGVRAVEYAEHELDVAVTQDIEVR